MVYRLASHIYSLRFILILSLCTFCVFYETYNTTVLRPFVERVRISGTHSSVAVWLVCSLCIVFVPIVVAVVDERPSTALTPLSNTECLYFIAYWKKNQANTSIFCLLLSHFLFPCLLWYLFCQRFLLKGSRLSAYSI